eukprot:2270061-Prymnesium_polylepis.1
MTVWAQGVLKHWARVHATCTHQWCVASLDQPVTTPRADPKYVEERAEFHGPQLACGFYLPSDHFVGLDPELVPLGEKVPIVPRFRWRDRMVRLTLSWGCLLGCMAVTIVAQLGMLAARTAFLAEAAARNDHT